LACGGVDGRVPWSKYDPYLPPADALAADSDEARRRALVLKWGSWITLAMVALGFGLIAYWNLR
jgi:predicted anti-sigma-YlaC factor YlaD